MIAATTPAPTGWMYSNPGIETYKVGDHTLWRVANLRTLKDGRFSGMECNIMPWEYPEPDHNRQRLVVACGMGTDSIAMLVGMYLRGIRPDVIQWADTGSERQHTYRYIPVLQQWLKRVGFPPLLIVRKRCPQAGHRSLFEQVWNTKQLPSAAFLRNHSCSIKWKLEPQRAWQTRCHWLFTPFSTAIGFDAEEAGSRKGIKKAKATEAVGFDADEAGKGRKSMRYSVDKSGDFEVWLPLAEWGLTRQDCVDLIVEAGLPEPGKSACFMCPISSQCELNAMNNEEPSNLTAAIGLETRFRESENFVGKVTGLGLRMEGRKLEDKKTWAESVGQEDPKGDHVGLFAGDLPAADIASVDSSVSTYVYKKRVTTENKND